MYDDWEERTARYSEAEVATLRRAASLSSRPPPVEVIVKKKEPVWIACFLVFAVFIISFIISSATTHAIKHGTFPITLPTVSIEVPVEENVGESRVIDIDLNERDPPTSPPLKRVRKKQDKKEKPHAWFHSLVDHLKR